MTDDVLLMILFAGVSFTMFLIVSFFLVLQTLNRIEQHAAAMLNELTLLRLRTPPNNQRNA